MVTYHRHKLGIAAENAACLFLENKGLTLLEKNFRTRLGEIDLIMQDQSGIVFVEVRSKQHGQYGSALESIDESKIKKLTLTATLYLQKHGWLNSKISRFDVIAIDLKHEQMQFEWVKNAF